MTSTDNFPHEDEHKATTEEGDWIASEPPVDDFGDASAEAATVSEGDEHGQEDVTEEAAVEEKKKFPVLLLLGAVGSLAVVGALAYWQFGGHRSEQPSLLDMAAQNAAPVSSPNFAPKPPASAAPSAPQEQTAMVAPTTAYTAPAAAPAASNAAKASSQQTGSAVTPAPAPAENAAAKLSAATDARLTVLSGRIDDLQKSLSEAAQQLSQISEKLTANQAAPAAPVEAQPDAATVERLNKLEQKLLQMEQRQVVAVPQKAVAEHAAVSMEEEFTPQPAKKSVHAAHKAKHKAARHKAARPPAKEKAAASWVLRAATPDEAWVAKNAETRELRPVHVGDDLAGIGKVTAIRQAGDSWIVQGTSGTVR